MFLLLKYNKNINRLNVFQGFSSLDLNLEQELNNKEIKSDYFYK